jgi:hypothetical protein
LVESGWLEEKRSALRTFFRLNAMLGIVEE